MTENIISTIISASSVLISGIVGAFLGSYISRKSSQDLIKANQDEAKRQREFEEFQSKQKFILQRKIEAFEFAVKVLPEFPKDVENLRRTWAAASLLYLYLPKEKINLASSFDLKGPETMHIPPNPNFPPAPHRQIKWAKDYEELRKYLSSEIEKLYSTYKK